MHNDSFVLRSTSVFGLFHVVLVFWTVSDKQQETTGTRTSGSVGGVGGAERACVTYAASECTVNILVTSFMIYQVYCVFVCLYASIHFFFLTFFGVSGCDGIFFRSM